MFILLSLLTGFIIGHFTCRKQTKQLSRPEHIETDSKTVHLIPRTNGYKRFVSYHN